MHFAIPEFHPDRTPEPPAIVSVVTRSDVLWNRPVFKAPPLVVETPRPESATFVDDIRWSFRREKRA